MKSQNVILERPLHFYGKTKSVAKLGDHGLSVELGEFPSLEIYCGEDEYLAPELVSQRE